MPGSMEGMSRRKSVRQGKIRRREQAVIKETIGFDPFDRKRNKSKSGDKNYMYEFRRAIKQRAVTACGGGCSRCGYNECLRALSFHHKPGEQKRFAISEFMAYVTPSRWESGDQEIAFWGEIAKCTLLCSNCHSLEHENQDRSRRLARTI